MGENLPVWQTKWLTYLVLLLLTIVTGVILDQKSSINDMESKVDNMPREYVQLERYKADQMRQVSTLDKIDSKLDKLIMERGKKG